MGKLHVITRKEEIDPHKVIDKVVVVLDVLIATTMITSALQHGAKEVIPVLTREEALKIARQYNPLQVVAAGEFEGRAMEGLLLPNPTELKERIKEIFVLSTTNGTAAMYRAAGAKVMYVASLLNGAAVARHICSHHADETVLLICAGSGGTFSLEDFYGAGYLSSCLTGGRSWELTDAAYAALACYRQGQAEEVLRLSRVGRALVRGGYGQEVLYAAQCGVYEIVPRLEDGKILVGRNEHVQSSNHTKGRQLPAD